MLPEFPEYTLTVFLSTLHFLILTSGALILGVGSVLPKIFSHKRVAAFTVAVLTASFICMLLFSPETPLDLFSGSLTLDRMGQLLQGTVLIISVVTCFICLPYVTNIKFFTAEVSAIFLITVLGILVFLSSYDLITIFVGLELASIGLYVLVGYINTDRRSIEGAVKYFTLGAFATGFFLFGASLLYASSGSLDLRLIADAMTVTDASFAWSKIGYIFVFITLFFKLALAPFHMWAPDAYESAPTFFTTFMATAVKVMVIGLLVRILPGAIVHHWESVGAFLVFGVVASALIGNILALVQTSLKRILAYSSVSHAGYLALGLSGLGQNQEKAITAVIAYLLIYCVLTLGAFICIIWLEDGENVNIRLRDLKGLGYKYPKTCVSLAAFLIGLAGIPPTAGFMGKFFIFAVALEAKLYLIVLIALLGAAIALYYYLRIIVTMFMNTEAEGQLVITPKTSYLISSIIGLALILNVSLGTFLPQALIRTVTVATQDILQAAQPLNR